VDFDPDPARLRLVQSAVLRLLAAVQTLRQHTGIRRLGEAAVGPAIAELVAVSAAGELELQIEPTAVCYGRHTVATHAAAAVPFGALAACGIGGLRLPAGMAADDVRRLLGVLAQGPTQPQKAAAWLTAFDSLALPGFWLCAARPGATLAATCGDEAWWLLPAPGQFAAAFQPLRERGATVDLAAAAADRLLDTLQTGAPMAAEASATAGPLLHTLLDTLCERGAVARLAEIFARVVQTLAIPGDERIRLRERLRSRFAGPWLAAQVQHPERWPGLATLALQLDGEALDQLAEALGPQAVPPWLQSLLPSRRLDPIAPH